MYKCSNKCFHKSNYISYHEIKLNQNLNNIYNTNDKDFIYKKEVYIHVIRMLSTVDLFLPLIPAQANIHPQCLWALPPLEIHEALDACAVPLH